MEKNNKINTIIFDFMGVLLFQKTDYKPNFLVDEIDKMIAHAVDDRKFETEARGKFKLNKDEFDDILEKVVDKYEKNYPLWNLLLKLRKHYKLAIINNGTVLTLPLFEERYKIKTNFDLFISSAKEGIRKPDKEIFLLTANRLGAEPSHCLFMDDLEENIKGAESAGIETIWWKNKEEGFNKFIKFIGYKKMIPLINNLIKQYNLSEPVNPQLIRESADNIVYIVGKKDKKILRISKRLPVEDIQFEFEIFEYLLKNNFPVPKWNKTKDGKSFAEAENTIAVLFDFLDGYQVKVDKDNLPNSNQAYTAGKYMALMHNISIDFKTSLPRKRNIFSELERALGKNKIFISELESGKEFIKQVEEAIKFGEEDKSINGLIHNDYRPGNVLFKNDNEISGVIDFDWSCNGPIIKDLALAVVEWSFPNDRIEPEWELFDSFLAGYNSITQNKYEKGMLLYLWIKFACISEACTFFADVSEGQYSDKVINSVDQCYMYKKYLFFIK